MTHTPFFYPARKPDFYSHALARRDPTDRTATADEYISTPTPSQGVTQLAVDGNGNYKISTPTPSQGVTQEGAHMLGQVLISTPTPSQGVTPAPYATHLMPRFLLPRPRKA